MIAKAAEKQAEGEWTEFSFSYNIFLSAL